MNFAELPPEINSIRMYSGPGSGPLLAAASAWDTVAAELHGAAAAYESTVTRLAGEAWLGPASQAMAAAATPYVEWLGATAVTAEQTAAQARAAAAAYQAAFAMTVPPSAVAANRAQLLALVATNVLGINTAAIAACEALYAEMWGQDAAAMYGYATAAAQAMTLARFTAPPPTATGPSRQAAGVGQDAASSAASGVQQALSQLGAQPMAGTPLPAQEIVIPDLLGLNALAVASTAGTYAGVALSAGAWASADQSTRLILDEQGQLGDVQVEILRNIDLYSPLTPSRPAGSFTPPPPVSAAAGEAVSVGKLSVPISWAANAPEIRTLAYTTPTTPKAGAGVAAAPAVAPGALGTTFSQMALSGMGGSALAGAVTKGKAEGAVLPGSPHPGKPAAPAEAPVTGIAAEIREFAELRDRGLISPEEYYEQRERLLGR